METTTENTLPFPAFTDNNTAIDDDIPNHYAPHKRSLSGSILSRLAFLRSSEDPIEKQDRQSTRDGAVSPTDSVAADTSRGALQPKKARKRKGSLRKALLSRQPESKAAKSPLSSPRSPDNIDTLSLLLPPDSDATPRPSEDLSPESPPRWTSPARKPSLSSIDSTPSANPVSSAASGTSATMRTDSTSDDDFPRIPVTIVRKPPSSSGDSYFPPQTTSNRRALRTRSPLAPHPNSASASPVASDEEWDYSETATCGYVLLTCCFLIFVVGMGSCLGVWTYAWDGKRTELTHSLCYV